MSLARYAVTEKNSRGRLFPVVQTDDRNEFQRDYTRVLHSQAFRRLQQKTQVFSANLGDLFRTRITHSLEVDQVARSIARPLGLNGDLCGVLAIAHDIGHAPFGHMGQDMLNTLMRDYGGFEHNLQALRLVDKLESPYPDHLGLNLMFETREGLLKHCSKKNALGLGEVAARHLDGRSASLEAQVVDWADAIAYVHADLEDAFLMGVLSPEQLQEAPGYLEAWERVKGTVPLDHCPGSEDTSSPETEPRRVAGAVVRSVLRNMMSVAIKDVIRTSLTRLRAADPASPEEARRHTGLIGFSAPALRQHRALKKFSSEHIYAHEDILSVRRAERKILLGLFKAFEGDPSLLPHVPHWEDKPAFYRHLADQLSGMTDRYAVDVFTRLVTEHPEKLPAECLEASQAKAANPQCYPRPY